MLLLDHFRPPLSTRRHWHSFHNAWATYLASDLNRRLPEGFFAEPNVQFGIEIDVAAFEERNPESGSAKSPENGPNNGPANAQGSSPESAQSWQPGAPTEAIAFSPSDAIVEVSILGSEGGPTLNAAIELVSPANKDRPQQRSAFVSKCETYLREGVGLVVVDVVTTRQANLHRELLARFSEEDERAAGVADAVATEFLPSGLYAVAYRSLAASAASRTGGSLQIWYESFGLGQPLPTLPLWLRQGHCLPLALQETYAETCHSQRISD